MKGVILAGGTGSRLRPLTSVTNKHLLPIYDKPMIYYPLEALKSAGVKEILIVTGKDHAGDVFSLMGSGKDFGVKFTYKIQDEAGGIPQAIGLAENFVGNDKFISINGDNVIFESLKEFADEFEKNKGADANIFLFETTREEAQKAGVVMFDETGKVKQIIEKPKEPPTNWVSTGILMFSPKVFEIIKTLKPSARGELEIADVQNYFIQQGTLTVSKLRNEWLDAGTIDELWRVNVKVKEMRKNGV